MKKYITILILIGLLSTSLPIHAQEEKRDNEKSEFVKEQVKKQKKKKPQLKNKAQISVLKHKLLNNGKKISKQKDVL